jgi:aryl-alcohol dehydrogenase-like predicted oxidoreductase
MKYINIKNTDIKVSSFAFGAAAFGGIDDELAGKLFDSYREKGGNFIDTANIYGKWLPNGLNNSELAIGRLLKDRGCRKDIVLGTKGAHPNMNSMNIPRLSKDEITSDLEESLKALQTDYIDIYWLHRDDPSRPVEEIMEILNSFIRAGKVRAIGCSNWSASRIQEALDHSSKKGIIAFCADQNHYNLAKVNDEVMAGAFQTSAGEDTIKLYKENKITPIPYSSQAQGLFSKALEKDFYTNPKYDGLRKLYLNPITERRISAVKIISRETGYEPTQIALAYLKNQPFEVVPIISTSSIERLYSIFEAAEIKLNEKQMSSLL